jgi:hypothetical protein
MNTASPYHSDFFTVAASRAGLRIRNDEVVGSIPTSSTKINLSKKPLSRHDVKIVPPSYLRACGAIKAEGQEANCALGSHPSLPTVLEN